MNPEKKTGGKRKRGELENPQKCVRKYANFESVMGGGHYIRPMIISKIHVPR